MPDSQNSQNSRDYKHLIYRINNLLKNIMEKDKKIDKLYRENQDLYDKIIKDNRILNEIKELKSRNEELEKEKNYYKEKALKYEIEIKIHQNNALKYEDEKKMHQKKENELESELELYKKKNKNYMIQNLELIKRSNESYLESLKSLEESMDLYEKNQNLKSLINNYKLEKSLNEMRNPNNK